MNDLYHNAARTGAIEVIKTATRRDVNKKDEDGMTPVHWAASCGHLDCLRHLIIKGGDADKSNSDGATAVHLSAGSGHLNCLTYLTQFGANIWALDNDGHTPLEEAAMRGQMDSVRYLDQLTAHQLMYDKNVSKMKKRAERDALKRAQKQEKLQRRMDRDYERRVKREQKGNTKVKESSMNGSSLLQVDGPKGSEKNKFSELTAVQDSSSEKDDSDKKSILSLNIFRSKKKRPPEKKIAGDDIMLLKNSTLERSEVYNGSLSKSVPSLLSSSSTTPSSYWSSDSSVTLGSSGSSTYSGVTPRSDVLDKNKLNKQIPMMLLNGKKVNGSLASRGTVKSTGSIGECSLAETLRDNAQSEIGTITGVWGGISDDEQLSSLVTFLASLNLEQFASTLMQESIDLRALSLCTDNDLKDIGLPLGPRRKIIDAVRSRDGFLRHPGNMTDTNI